MVSHLTFKSFIRFGLIFMYCVRPWSLLLLGFPGGSAVNNASATAGNVGSIPRSGRSSGEKKWQATLVFLPGEPHGQRSLVGHRPGGSQRVGQNNKNKDNGLVSFFTCVLFFPAQYIEETVFSSLYIHSSFVICYLTIYVPIYCWALYSISLLYVCF